MDWKLIKLAEDNWGWDLGTMRIIGFPTVSIAIEWHVAMFTKLTQAGSAEETRRKLIGAALLAVHDKKTQ